MAEIRIGFTGTRKGLTLPQEKSLKGLLGKLKKKHDITAAHQGCAIGADEVFALAADALGIAVKGHPSNLESQTSERALLVCDEVFDPMPPLVRNRMMVDRVQLLIACPAEMEEQARGGTWSTIRYARKLSRLMAICWPDGSLTWENVL